MLKKLKKIILYFVLFIFASFFIWIGYLLSAGRDAAILMYHSVGEPMEKHSLNVSQEAFEKQMAFLSWHRYNVISLLDLAQLLRDKKKIPPKTVVITFDDGYENNYTKAFPILKKYKLPATIFLVSNFLGKEEVLYGHNFQFMTAKMAREMSESGLITFGAHSENHVYLPDISDEKILHREIYGVKEDLERILGKPIYAFCYPIGGYTPEIEKEVRRAGYLVAVTTLPKRGFAHNDIYALKRVKVSEGSGNMFKFFIETSGYYIRMKEMSK